MWAIPVHSGRDIAPRADGGVRSAGASGTALPPMRSTTQIMNELYEMSRPWWEFALRGALTYGIVLGLVRLVGKRQVGEYTSMDLVLLLLVGGAAANAVRSDDTSIAGAAIAIATMLAMNALLRWMGVRFKWFDKTVEGEPRFLIKRGTVDYAALRELSVTRGELLEALRKHGCFSPREVEYAILESSGDITVRQRKA
jgi:uncharacterized membrane protein YcaP (DUF421 family)